MPIIPVLGRQGQEFKDSLKYMVSSQPASTRPCLKEKEKKEKRHSAQPLTMVD